MLLSSQGQFGRVYCAVMNNGSIQAAKIVDDPNVSRKEYNMAQHLQTLSTNHRFLVLTYTAFQNQESKQMVFFMDYADRGNLGDIIEKNTKTGIPETIARKIIYMIAYGLTQLHLHNFVHRDIKPDNLLLSYDPGRQTVRVLLSDYGLLRQIGEAPSNGESMNLTVCGTPLYMSPEALNEDSYSHSVDIWALGCIAYELVQGTHPFMSSSILDLHRRVNQPVPPVTQHVSAECRDFINDTLHIDPVHRLSAHRNLITHRWFVGLNETNCELSWDEFQMAKREAQLVSKINLSTQTLPALVTTFANRHDVLSGHTQMTVLLSLPGTPAPVLHPPPTLPSPPQPSPPHPQPQLPTPSQSAFFPYFNQPPHSLQHPPDTPQQSSHPQCSSNPSPQQSSHPQCSSNPSPQHSLDSLAPSPSPSALSSTPLQSQPKKFNRPRQVKEREDKLTCEFCKVGIPISRMDTHLKEAHRDRQEPTKNEPRHFQPQRSDTYQCPFCPTRLDDVPFIKHVLLVCNYYNAHLTQQCPCPLCSCSPMKPLDIWKHVLEDHKHDFYDNLKEILGENLLWNCRLSDPPCKDEHTRFGLLRHYQKKDHTTDSRPYKILCPFCFAFEDRKKFKEHVLEHNIQKVDCSRCSRSHDPSYIVQHTQSCKKPLNDPQNHLHCPLCGFRDKIDSLCYHLLTVHRNEQF
ncbi:putative serine/threonine protein kinase [Blattamonas nauphoetae]|uniref:Serine/threonine protein kinase n=1 Tax=Blattamonas nauphoetae TaxID=2049346 RepID=A0ABQ9XBK0_9EUKA|nr:putative serine/threonine protein kinase [Blattamonas nauphoetae]